MATQTTPKIVSKDNGYFEIWQLPCGHQVRNYTEDQQWTLRTSRGARTRMHAATQQRLAAAPCRTCATS